MAAVIGLLLADSAAAQYFGRNKVLHEQLDFKILRTEHFDIYHYEAEAEAARLAARLAERWYARLSRVLGYQMQSRQPLILYASQPHFRQTNAVEGAIGEGTGGVTESFKRRIVLPLGATLADTDHVIGHELVHAFQFAMTGADAQGAVAGMPSALRLPLWFVEGMAEYLSIGPVDAHTAMWLRDAAARDQLPTVGELDDPDFFPYRYGHAFWAYVAGRWGDDIVRDSFLAAADRRGGGIEALERVLGVDMETLSGDWHRAVKDQYSPILAATTPAAEVATPLINEKRHGGRMNLAPELSPDGSRVVYLSERDLFSIDVFLADAATGQVIRKLVSTAADPHFDSLQFIGSAGTWHPDGHQFALAAIRAGRPVLTIVDIADGDRVREIELRDLGEIFNPAWSPDGGHIAFSATKGGFSNLYTYDLTSSRLRQLTDDAFTDVDPAWSPDGRRLVFATDRFTTDLGELTIGDMRLALLDVATGTVESLSALERGKHISPQWTPDGQSIYFVGNPTGISNVYRLDAGSRRTTQVTNTQSGVSGITAFSPALSVASKSGRMAFTLYTDDEYWVMTADTSDAAAAARSWPADLDAAVLPPRRAATGDVAALLENPTVGLPQPNADFPVEEYKPSLSLDMIGQPMIGAGVDSFGSYLAGGISAYFSDMLGNRQLGVAVQASGTVQDVGGQVLYLDRSRRWILGGTLEYLPYRFGSFGQALGVIDGQEVLIEQSLMERQTNSSAAAIAAYPFNQASRLELTGGVQRVGFSRQIETALFSPLTGDLISEDRQDLPSPDSVTLGFAGAALVYDTSVFGVTSPILGRRFRFDVTQAGGSLTYTSALADFRQYFMPFRPVTLAFRGLHFGRYGGDSDDPRLQTSYLGYPQLVRGYDVNSFEARECRPGPAGECQAFDQTVGSRMLVGNAEVRVPLWAAFGGNDFYGPLPVELAAFADIGVAWDDRSSPAFAGGDREAVRSVGAAIRVNAFGYAVVQIDYVRPLDRPSRGWFWQFTLQPGF